MRIADLDALAAELIAKGFYPAIVARAIENAPTVDAVPVVRCKNCKYLLYDLSIRKYHLCMRLRIPQRVNFDDFCSFGEKEGE